VTRTIAVTGARGFIGATILRRLTNDPDTRIIALARSRPPDTENRSVHWIQSNLEDLTPSHWQRAGSSTLDALIHLAAYTPKVSADRDHAQEIISANVVGTQTLLASLREPPRRLVFCSTLDVYAQSAFEYAVDERSAIGPIGLYGLSKLLGEGLIESYARSPGIEHVSLRLGHIYGPGEERYAKLVPETIRRVLAGMPPRIAGDGTDKRDLLYVDDAAEAIVRSCTARLNGVRIVNIARGESYSILSVVQTVTELTGYQGIPERLPRVTEAHSTLFDTSLMQRILGPWSFVPLAEGLRREVTHFKNIRA
jgi:UDP-glucose 4-epimerase